MERLRAAVLGAFDLKAAFVAEADARRLFLWAPVCMGIGVLLFFAADGVPSPWPALVSAAACATFAGATRARLTAPALLAGAAFLFLGFAAAAWRTGAVGAPVLDRAAFAKLSGFVETVDAGASGGRLVLVVTSMEATGAPTRPQRLRATFRGAPPRAGDHLAGQARLMPPPQPTFPGGYDFARDAYYQQIGAVGRWTGPMTLAPAPEAAAWRLRWRAGVDNARTDLTNRIARAIGGQGGALSAALVTGKRGLLEERVNDDLRASGLYHIVSISGLHMVLAAGVFFWLARGSLALLPGVAERWPIKKWAAVIAMAGATAYCIFSGSEVATERSLIMTLVMFGAILFDRPAISMRNLAIAALIVLALEPETIVGPSFQMSFAAVAGMIAAHEWWIERRGADREPPGWGGIWVRRLLTAVVASLAATLIASLATAPFAAFHFQRLNPYGLIGNALAIPFVSFVVMPAAVVGTLLLPFGLDGPVWQLMGIGSDKVLEVAAWVAKIDGSVRGLRAFPVGPLLWMAAGFVVLVLVRSPLRMAGLAAIAVAALAAGRMPPPDVIVDRQGRIAALRGQDERLRILARSTSRFTIDRWLAADGDLRKGDDASLKAGTACDRVGCVGLMADGAAVALVLEAGAFEEDCRRARLVITPLPAPAFCGRTAKVIDRARLAAAASLALRRSGTAFLVEEARPQGRWKPWFGRAEAPPPSPSAEKAVPATTPEPSDDGAEMLMP